MSAMNPDLTPFKRHGGKIISYSGWSDPVVPPEDVIGYYASVTKQMGGAAKTAEFYRLFMAPGMGHCTGGPGPNNFDALAALEEWIEKGIPPEKMVATHSTSGKIDRSRPLCPYPLAARYKGTGSIDEAVNFACTAEPARK
jgi:feruloyl esterase